MLDVTDPYQAYCVDEAISFFGNAVDAEMAEAREKTKGSPEMKNGAAENAMRQMLGMPKKYASPTPGGTRHRERPSTPSPEERE